VFVVLEVGTRQILHWNVTEHPTADWTAQQFRMIVLGKQAQRFVIHDRDTIYSDGVDRTLEAMGLTVLKTSVHVPQASAFCERVIGTIRRECVDFITAIAKSTFARLFESGSLITIAGRPHASLGPGLPECSVVGPVVGDSNGHSVPIGYRVAATPILGGLHHEYRLERRQRDMRVNNFCGSQPSPSTRRDA
jgi:hypothetical protein